MEQNKKPKSQTEKEKLEERRMIYDEIELTNEENLKLILKESKKLIPNTSKEFDELYKGVVE